tara:strand:+ start:595 stop:864 length:270 start_codon:yes stop_codon:yes gene_type:complete
MKKSPKFSFKAHTNKITDRALYLINDEYNTFEHVINCLVTLCDHNELQAEQCAFLTHYKGSCEIAIGKVEQLIPLKDDLVLYGLDVEIL